MEKENYKYKNKQAIMRKGDIIKGRDRNNTYHPIAYLEKINEDSFTGCIFTHDDARPENIKMLPEHFEKVDSRTGQRYKFQYDKTCMVIIRFVKMNDWVRATPVGRLSESGIRFVEEHLPTEAILHDQPVRELTLVDTTEQ